MGKIEKFLNEVGPMSSDIVFSYWRDGESKLPRWIEHYQNRGFSSWDEWRKNSIKELGFENLSWKLYKIREPMTIVPSFYGGPFRPWIKNHYNGKDKVTFSEIIKDPKLQHSVLIKEIIENFPKQTTLIGLRTEYGIVIIEGMHRCCAIAFAFVQEKTIETEINIAIADFIGREIPLLGKEDSPTTS